MVIGNPRKYGELKGLLALRVGDNLIRRVKQTKSLGVIIDQNLSWDSHIDYTSKNQKKYWNIKKAGEQSSSTFSDNFIQNTY